jgi:hypothetical protein
LNFPEHSTNSLLINENSPVNGNKPRTSTRIKSLSSLCIFTNIPFQRYLGDDTMIVADHVARAIEIYKVDKTFIDGIGVGGGVVDRLKQMGYGTRIVEVAKHQYY